VGFPLIPGLRSNRWCTEDKIAQPRCAPPEDLHYVLQQLAVETGCPISSIRQLQFFGTSKFSEHVSLTRAALSIRVCMR
jgi:hypothetical protein